MQLPLFCQEFVHFLVVLLTKALELDLLDEEHGVEINGHILVKILANFKVLNVFHPSLQLSGICLEADDLLGCRYSQAKFVSVCLQPLLPFLVNLPYLFKSLVLHDKHLQFWNDGFFQVKIYFKFIEVLQLSLNLGQKFKNFDYFLMS